MGIKKYTDIFAFGSLTLVFLILVFVFWQHTGNPMIDGGREAYVPSLMLEGKTLIKDIFILYPPLSYQINSLLYFVFGENLSTLYMAGAINSYFILIVIFLICRELTSRLNSWIICFLVMSVCMFNYGLAGFIFPYSFAIVYALSSLLISILCLIKYYKYESLKFLFLSAFFAGLSLAFKVDFALFLIAILITIFLTKPMPKKALLYLFGVFSIAPVLSYFILFFQGVSVENLINYGQSMLSLTKTVSFNTFYTNSTGLFYSNQIVLKNAMVFLNFIFNFFILVSIFYTLFFIFHKLPKFPLKKFFEVIAFILVLVYFPKILIKKIVSPVGFSWVPVLSTFIILGFVCKKLLEYKNNSKDAALSFYSKLTSFINWLSFKDKILILIGVASVLVSFKSYYFINLIVFGSFLLPLGAIFLVVFLLDYLTESVSFLDKKSLKKAFCSVLLIIGLCYLMPHIYVVRKVYNTAIHTEKGTIFFEQNIAAVFNEVIEFLNEHTDKNTKVLVLPEGSMINFLTGRPSDEEFYSLTPNFIEAFEPKAIDKFSDNKPDYFIITSQLNNDYGYSYFGSDYAIGIRNFIKKNYKLVRKIKSNFQDNSFSVNIYKKN